MEWNLWQGFSPLALKPPEASLTPHFFKWSSNPVLKADNPLNVQNFQLKQQNIGDIRHSRTVRAPPVVGNPGGHGGIENIFDDCIRHTSVRVNGNRPRL